MPFFPKALVARFWNFLWWMGIFFANFWRWNWVRTIFFSERRDIWGSFRYLPPTAIFVVLLNFYIFIFPKFNQSEKRDSRALIDTYCAAAFRRGCDKHLPFAKSHISWIGWNSTNQIVWIQNCLLLLLMFQRSEGKG